MIKEIKESDIGYTQKFNNPEAPKIIIHVINLKEAQELKQFILSRCSKEAIEKEKKILETWNTWGKSMDELWDVIKNAEIVKKLRKLLPSIEEDYRILCSLQDEDYTKASNTPKRLKEIKSILGDEK